MLSEILADGESRDGEDALGAHQPHGFETELIGMVDGSNAGLRGEQCARFTRRMHSDAFADAGSLLHGGAEFRFRELIRRRESAAA